MIQRMLTFTVCGIQLRHGSRNSGRGISASYLVFCIMCFVYLALVGCAELSQMGAVDKPSADKPGEIKWRASFEEATEAARAENKPMMLVFYGVSSKRLDSRLFSSPDAIELAQKFVCLKVGANQDEIIQKYNVYKFPTIVFADPQGGKYDSTAPGTGRSFVKVLETALIPVEVEYSMAIRPSQGDSAHVKCVFRNVRRGSLVLSLLDRHDEISNISYNSTDGLVEWVELAKDVWQMKFGTTMLKTVTVEYEVGLNILSTTIGNDYASYVDDDYGILDGHTAFLSPQDLHMIGKIDIHLDLPPGWRAITPWQENGPSSFVADSLEEAVDSVFCIGNFQFAKRQFGDHEIYVVHRADRKVDPEYLERRVDNIVTIFGDYVTRFGDFPYKNYLAIFAQPAPDGRYIHGSAHSTGFAGPVNVGPSFVAHEIFHVWNGGIANQKSDYEGWFKEGFTEYYGYLTPYRVGLYSEERFLQHLKRNYEGYLKRYGTKDDIALTRVKEQLARKEHREQSWSAKIWSMYHKGSLVASLMDSEIRKRTYGRKNLDDLMDYMFQEFRGKRYSSANILEALNAVTGQDFSQFFSDYVYGRTKLPAEAASYQ